MNRNKRIALFILILIGFIVPFFPALTFIQFFFLLIPFGVIFIITLTYLIVSIFNKKLDTRRAIFIFSILPIFLMSQLSSVYIVDKFQKSRSGKIILEVEKQKMETGVLPTKYNQYAGIEYTKMKNEEHYIIEYSIGFLVTEKYDSKNKTWESYGWND